MKNRAALAALLLAAFVCVWSVEPGAIRANAVTSQPGDLKTLTLDSAPFHCTGEWQTVEYTAVKSVRIYQAELWLGMFLDNIADLGAWLKRASDGGVLFATNWDHYSNPTGVSDETLTRNFTPNFMYLAAGDSLVLAFSCKDLLEPGGVGQVVATVWYLEP